MTCRVCLTRDAMGDFLAGRLPSEEEALVVAHLQQCPDCERLASELSDDPEARQYRSLRAAPTGAETGGDTLAELQERLCALPLLASDPHRTARIGDSETAQWTRGQHLPPAPQRLGKFEIIRALGMGGFGVVYLALDTVLNRQVALKLPRGSALANPDARRRFQQEAQALARLSHPHIVPVYEAGEHEGMFYLAVGFCSGPTLAEWREEQGGRIDPWTAATILLQLAQAVQHAHDLGILHRDIKPSNVLLNAAANLLPGDGTPTRAAGAPGPATLTAQLADFGLAKLQGGGRTDATTIGVVLGTPRYLAPEQAGGLLDRIGPATDIYSLGAVGYELLTGQPPIDGDEPAEILRRVLLEEPIPPHKLVAAVPAALDAMVVKCLQKSPRARYATAGELAADLQRFLADQRAPAPPPVPAPEPARFQRRTLAVAGALLATLLLAVAAWAAVQSLTHRPGASTAAGSGNPSPISALAAATAVMPAEEKPAEETPPDEPPPDATWAPVVASGSAAPAPCPPGLVAFWPADGDANDHVGNHHAQLVGGVTFGRGMVGRAFKLDGADDYIRVPNHTALNPTAGFTIEGWIRSNCRGSRTIVGKWDPTTGECSYNLQDVAAPEHRFKFVLTESKHSEVSPLVGRSLLAPDVWTHVAATCDKRTSRLYVNGVLDSTGTLNSGRNIKVSSSDLVIGLEIERDGKRSFFSGLVDELSLYDRALAEGEIAAIARAGSAGKLKLTSHESEQNLASASECFNKQQFDQAEVLFRELWLARRARLGPDHWLSLYAQNRVGVCLWRQKRYADAEPFLVESHDALAKSSAAPWGWQANFTEHLVDLYSHWCEPRDYASREFAQLLHYRRELWPLRQQTLGPRHMLTLDAENLLGHELTGARQLAAAEQHLVHSYDEATQTPNFRADWRRLYVQRLINLYDVWSKPTKAAHWRKKLAEIDRRQDDRSEGRK